MENEDNKVKELKSDIEDLTQKAQDRIHKKYEQNTGTKWEDRWHYWKRFPLAWVFIILIVLINIIFLNFFYSILYSNPIFFSAVWLISFVIEILLIYLIIKKVVYRKNEKFK